MKMIRRYIAFLLIAVLTLTGHSMAMARGASGPDGFIEICTGQGLVLVASGETGDPTGASHLCPDCAFLTLAVLGPSQSLPVSVQTSQTVSWVAHITRFSGLNKLSPSARGPPFVV